MSDLVPEKRLDSSGKLVTRWVRAGEAPTASPLNIPAPVASTPEPFLPLRPQMATPATLRDLDSFFREKKWRTYSFATPLIDNFSRMPDNLAAELVAYLRERDTFHGVFELGMSVKRVFGSESWVPIEIRETVFRNLADSIPTDDMLVDGDSAGSISFATAVFIGMNGMNKSRRVPESEARVYASIAAVALHIFGNDPDVFDVPLLRSTGFDVSNDQLRLQMRSTEAANLLLKHADHIDSLRDELIARKSLKPDVVRAVISADGALRSGVL